MWMDSYICPSTRNDLPILLVELRKMGYSSVGLCADIYEQEKDLTELSKLYGISIFRSDLIETSNTTIAKKILKEKRASEIVIGKPISLDVYRFMSRDSRFTIIEVSPKLLIHIDRGEAELLKIGGSYLGFNLKQIINKPSNLSFLKSFLTRTLKWSIPFRFYSSATNVYETWHPKHIYFIAQSLGFHGKRVLEGISTLDIGMRDREA